MRRITVTLFPFVLLLLACKDNSLTPLDREAFDAGERLYKTTLTKCGDSYIGQHIATGDIVEMKTLGAHGLNMDQRWKPNTADQLNGLEWTGQCAVFCAAFRVLDKSKGWSEWQAGTLFVAQYRDVTGLPLNKVKGEWIINDGKPLPFKPVPCDQVPVG